MNLDLHDSRVLVSGGASNIGRAIVHAFAREGSRIAICDLDGQQAAKVHREAEQLGASAVLTVEADLTVPGAAQSAVDQVTTTWGGIDALVNNAGWSIGEFLARDDDRARWQRLADINIFASIELTRAATAVMSDSDGGSIVWISSEAAFGQIRQGVYGATKAAQIALARTTAREYGRHGVRSNVVCPGLVIPEGPDAVGETSLWADGQDDVFDQKQIDYLLRDTPLGRLTNADDIAHSVLWLSSNTAARQITGQVIAVSGGYTMP